MIFVTAYVQVNRMVQGRTAIHEACKDGYISVLKTLLNFDPDLEKLVNAKHTLHISKPFIVALLYFYRMSMDYDQSTHVHIGNRHMIF